MRRGSNGQQPAVLVAGLVVAACVAGCATSLPGSDATAAGTRLVPAAASINAWGSILAQLGGAHVQQTSIVSRPGTDPHDYEPTPADGVVIAKARLFVENGIGYDSWAAKSLAASPDPARRVVDVGVVTHTAAGGNPHRWYSPGAVTAVADAITADLERLDPTDRGYFAARRRQFTTVALAGYHRLIGQLRSRYAGTPVGASESIVSPLAQALGLRLLTPASFLQDLSEGVDPSAADLSAIDAQLTGHEIAVYVYDSQNATPDVAAQLRTARAADIPVVGVTETLAPAGATFQQWQTRQLRALGAALHRATGR